jgi:uncharacterized membrane-anchored protein YjiN (DUF445 family)
MNVPQRTTGKAIQLKRHKRLATGLFLLMVVVYSLMTYLSRTDPSHWIGYVKAFSEAAMVGALADWFAVTALFHHPLGIPIPHTNLIEKSKQSIGNNLGDFVVQNFLTPQNIRPYIQKLSLSAYAAEWLTGERNKMLLISGIVKILKDIVVKMDDTVVSGFMARKGAELIDTIKLNQVVAQALHYLLEQKEQEKLVTTLAGRIKQFIGENEEMIQEKVKEESYFFVPKFIEQKLAAKISGGLSRYFEEIEKDENHKIRTEINQQLAQLVEDMRTQDKWKENFEQLKQGLLSEEKVGRYAADIWQSLKHTLISELSDEQSSLSRYFSRMVDELSDNLKQDEALRNRIDSWIRLTAYKYILRNTEYVGVLISNTVGNWEGRELSQKLELEVGKDLQYIRINGTLVGGLVGLLIYAITHLLS